MGKLTYQGDSPFRVMPARPSTARASGRGVEMTVYAMAGKGPIDVQIHVPMTPDGARQLATELITSAIEAEGGSHG
jgi:hypothetical protein